MKIDVGFGEKSPQIAITMTDKKEVDVIISSLQKKVAEQPGNDKEMELHVIAEKLLMRLNLLKNFLP